VTLKQHRGHELSNCTMTPTSPRVPQVATPANHVRDGIVGLFAEETRLLSADIPEPMGNDRSGPMLSKKSLHGFSIR
jgi:hypothetical protein